MPTNLLPIDDITQTDVYRDAPLSKKLESLNSWGAYNAEEVRKLGVDSEEYSDTQNGLQKIYDDAVDNAFQSTMEKGAGQFTKQEDFDVWKEDLAKSINGIPDLTADAFQTPQVIGTKGQLVDMGSKDQADIAMTLTRRRRLDGKLEVNVNKSGVTGVDKTIMIDVDPRDARNISAQEKKDLVDRKENLEQSIIDGPDASQAEIDFLGSNFVDKEHESNSRKKIEEIDTEIASLDDRMKILDSGNGRSFIESETLKNELTSRFKDDIQEDVFSIASLQEVQKGVVNFGTGVVAGAGRLAAVTAGAVGAEKLEERINRDADAVERTGEDFLEDFNIQGRAGGRVVGGMGERIFSAVLNESVPLLGQIAISGGTSLLVKGAGKGIGKFLSTKAGAAIVKNAGRAGVLVGGMSGGAREVAGSYTSADEFITRELGDYETVELMEADAELRDDDALRKKAKSIRSARDTMVFNLYASFVSTTGLEMIPLGKIMKRGNKTAFDIMDETMTKIVKNNVDNAVKGGKALTGSWDTIKRIGGDILSGAFEESSTEGVQTLVNNATAKALYDENKDLFEGVAEAVAVGAILGSLANSAASIIGEKGARKLLKNAQEGVDAKGRIDEAADRFDKRQIEKEEAQAKTQELKPGVVKRNGVFVTMNPATKRVETFETAEGANNFSDVAEDLSGEGSALPVEELTSELEAAGDTIRETEAKQPAPTEKTLPTEPVAQAEVTETPVPTEKNTGTENRFLAREVETTNEAGETTTTTRANLKELTPEGTETVHYETSLQGLKSVVNKAEEGGPRTLAAPIDVKSEAVARRRKPGKKYVVEIDPEQVQGDQTDGGGLTVDKTTPGSVTAIIAPNEKGVAALRKSKRMNKVFDFDKAEKTPTGIRIPRKVVVPQKAVTGGRSFPLKAKDLPQKIDVEGSLELQKKLENEKGNIEEILNDKKRLQGDALLADKSRIQLKGELEASLKDVDARLESVNGIINSGRFKKQAKRDKKEAKRQKQRDEFDAAQEKAEADALRRMGSDINPITGAVSNPSRPFDNQKTDEQTARDSIPEDLIPPPGTQPESTTKAITRNADGEVEGVTDTDPTTLLASTGVRADRRRAKIAQFRKGFKKFKRKIRNMFLGDPIQQVKFLLPAELTEEKAKRENQQSAIVAALEFVTRQYTRAFAAQLSKDNLQGQTKKVREDEVNKAVMDYMTESDRVTKAEKLRNIPRGMRAVVYDMRRTIDGLSEQLIDTGVVEDEAVAIVKENLGAYLHRSYQLFNEPGYAATFEYGNLTQDQKIIINRAKQFFKREGSAVSEEEANWLIEFYLDPFNFNGGLVDTVNSSGAASLKGKLSKQQMAILKGRKDVPQEIRALWGEVEDPLYNYINSVTKLAALVTSHGFLNDLKAIGEKEGIMAPPGSKVEGLNAKISQEGAKALSPIDGWLMTPDLRDSLQVAYADGFENQYGAFVGFIMRVNQIAKKSFTIYNPASQARNAISAFQAYVSNGHFNLANVARASTLVSHGFIDPKVRGGITQAAFVKAKKAGIINPATTLKEVREQNAEYVEMIELGLLDQDIFSAEFAQVMAKIPKNASIDWIAGVLSNPITDAAAKGGKKVDEALSKFYRSVDGLIKVADYNSNLNALVKANKKKKKNKRTIAELKVEAAARTKATIPTYDRIPESIKKLSRTPFFGMFVAYPAESWRTTYNQFKLAGKDLATENMRGEGIKRMAGMMIARSFYPVAAMLSREAAGINSEDDERFRESMPIYDQKGDILYDQQDKPGTLSYLNTQYIDAYSSQRIVYGSISQMFREPAEDIFSTNPRKGVADVVISTLGPFSGTEAGFKAMIEVLENRDHFGREIYDENNIAEAVGFGLYHVAKSVAPKALSEADKVFQDPEKNTIENAAERIFNPVRFKSMDMKRALHFKMQDLNKTLTLNSKVFVDSIIAGEDIGESINIAEEGRSELYRNAGKAVQSTILTKVPVEETAKIVDDSDLNFVEADSVMSFEAPLFTLTTNEAMKIEKVKPGFIREFNERGYKVFNGKKIVDFQEIEIEALQEAAQEKRIADRKAQREVEANK